MKKNTDIRTLTEKLFSAKSVALFPHVNPDGDCSGACAALCIALRNAGIEAYVYTEAVPRYLKFINTGYFTEDYETLPYPDVCAAVDCSEGHRLEERAEAFERGNMRLCIDHHINELGFGDLYYIDEEAAATCEIIYDMLKEADVELTRDIANALYTGIITDTGGFRYSNTTVRSHEIAADLLRTGVDHESIMVNLYNNKSLRKVQCESKAIDKMMIFADGRGAISYLTSAEMAQFDAHHEDADEIIDRLRDIEGVEMAAYLEERENGIKVSMRAKTDTSVVEICVRNGGGGHAKAAGCTIKTTMEKAFTLIKDEMEETLFGLK